MFAFEVRPNIVWTQDMVTSTGGGTWYLDLVHCHWSQTTLAMKSVTGGIWTHSLVITVDHVQYPIARTVWYKQQDINTNIGQNQIPDPVFPGNYCITNKYYL